MQQRATREPEPQGQLSVSVHGMGRTATKIASAPTSRAVSLIRYPMNSLPRPDIGEGMTAVAPGGADVCASEHRSSAEKPVMACSGSRRPRGFHIQQSTYPRGRGHASDVCTKRPRCAAGTDLRQRALTETIPLDFRTPPGFRPRMAAQLRTRRAPPPKRNAASKQIRRAEAPRIYCGQPWCCGRRLLAVLAAGRSTVTVARWSVFDPCQALQLTGALEGS